MHASLDRIVFDRVGKTFGDARTLDRFTLRVAPGEIVAVAGPTGCGKTTALNLACGFEEPSEGSLAVNGSRAVVFQQPALFPWLSVIDNVALGLRCHGIARSVSEARARRLLEEVGLSEFSEHFPYQISGGMQQRTQIARALIGEPDVLLMDEPFGALDYQTRLLMQKLLLRLWSQFKPSILFITHDVAEAIFIADRVVAMSRRPGRVKREFVVSSPKPRDYDFFGSAEFVATQRDLIRAVQEEVEESVIEHAPVAAIH